MRACDPATALAALAAHQPLPRHNLTVLEDQPGLRQAYGRAGYRLDDTETLMACELATFQLPDLDAGVTQVQTAAQADWHNANDPQGIRWVLADNLADPCMGHYAIVRGQQLVVRGRNLQLDAEHSYVSRIYVAEAWRPVARPSAHGAPAGRRHRQGRAGACLPPRAWARACTRDDPDLRANERLRAQ